MNSDIGKIIEIIRETVQELKEPVVTEITKRTRDPFKILISTIISLRTKDNVTREASKRLYEIADTPGKCLNSASKELKKQFILQVSTKIKRKLLLI